MKTIKIDLYKATFFIFLIFLLVFANYFIKRSNVTVQPVQENNANLSVKSKSGRYVVRLGLKNTLEIVTPEKPITLIPFSVVNSGIGFEQNNVTWSQDESIVILTYVVDVPADEPKNAYLDFYSTKTGNLISNQKLGTMGYYGNNIDVAYPPVVSPNGKYVTVQNGLIQYLSIYDINGKFISRLPTIYSKTRLFSDEIYNLDGGKYSPFLSYTWNADSKTINYGFAGSKIIHKLVVFK